MYKFNKPQQDHVKFESYVNNSNSYIDYNQSSYSYNLVNINSQHNIYNNDLNMLNLLQKGISTDLKSSSYEEISPEIWSLVDDLTNGVDTLLD